MSLEQRIRELVERGEGRAPVVDVVREALGLDPGNPALVLKLARSAVAGIRGLDVDGEHVVEVAVVPEARGVVALALARTSSPTALPAALAWTSLEAAPSEAGPDQGAPEQGAPAPSTAAPVAVRLDGPDWREQLVETARALAGAQVLALAGVSARRVLRLAASLAELEPGREPVVTALGNVARLAGRPLASRDDAAALVGADPPETPEEAAVVLGRLAEHLAGLAGVGVAELPDLVTRSVTPEFDFGERAFDRATLASLPEEPGTYAFEDADGDLLYVGKASNLRRRVASYFAPEVDERAGRIREAAHALTWERSGSELTALLREHELIRDLEPTLNVQERVHADAEKAPRLPGSMQVLAVVQASAAGGAEVVLLDRRRGVATAEVLPSAEDGRVVAALRDVVAELRRREPVDAGVLTEVEVGLRWLRHRDKGASLVDADGDLDDVAALLARVALDPTLPHDRIVPLT